MIFRTLGKRSLRSSSWQPNVARENKSRSSRAGLPVPRRSSSLLMVETSKASFSEVRNPNPRLLDCRHGEWWYQSHPWWHSELVPIQNRKALSRTRILRAFDYLDYSIGFETSSWDTKSSSKFRLEKTQSWEFSPSRSLFKKSALILVINIYESARFWRFFEINDRKQVSRCVTLSLLKNNKL